MKFNGNAKNIPDNPKALFLPFQEKWIKDNSRLKLQEKSRQIGASWSTGYKASERTSIAGTRWDQWVSSRDEIQARLFLEDCKMWAKLLNVAANDIGEVVVDKEKRISALVLEFANGRRIHSMSSNPDAQAGKRGGRILDEFALHPDPRKLWSIAYPGITWGGNMEIISTHRGSRNFFNELILEVKEKGNPKNISLHTVTLQNALDQGFLFKLQQALPKDHEVQELDEAGYFDYIRAGAADEESFLQEYMCIPGDDDVAFLEYDLIAQCEYTALDKWEVDIEQKKRQGSRFYAGIDIGRKNDLTVMWIMEELGDVLCTRKVLALKNMRKSDQEKQLWPLMAHMDRTSIDATGLGIGWADDAQDKFGKYRVEAVTFTAQMKEELAYPVRGKMEDKKLRLPYDKEIRADLRAVTKQVTSAGNIRFTAERNSDGHADRFWALALAIHSASKPAAQIDYMAGPNKSSRWDGGDNDDDYSSNEMGAW